MLFIYNNSNNTESWISLEEFSKFSNSRNLLDLYFQKITAPNSVKKEQNYIIENVYHSNEKLYFYLQNSKTKEISLVKPEDLRSSGHSREVIDALLKFELQKHQD